MKQRTLSDLTRLTAFGSLFLCTLACGSIGAGYGVASTGVVDVTVATAIGAFDAESAATSANYVSTVSIDSCTDGIDSDADSLVDCDDSDCFGNSFCSGYESSCINGADDDFDGLVDCADVSCSAEPSCLVR